VTSIETVQLLGAMQHLTHLTLSSKMFYGGDRARIDEWLRVSPPHFPLKTPREEIYQGGWRCSEANGGTADEASTQIKG
jgi:hypothetical protein